MKHLVFALLVGCGGVQLENPDASAEQEAPPETSITGMPPALDNAASVTFELASNDPAATFECRLDADPFAACTSPHTVTGFAEGPHEFATRAVVNGLVDATPATAIWTYDASAPDTTIIAGPAAIAASTAAGFQFSSPRASAVTFECAIDGAPFAPCVSPVALVALTEAPHTFAVRARDGIGNVDPSPAMHAWTVDITAPDTQMSGPTGLINTTTATFELLASELSTFECNLDGAGFAPCTSPFEAIGLAEGAHVMAARATDLAGNLDASPVDFTFEVDSIAPDTTIVSGPSSPTSASIFTFNMSSNEPGVTYECSQDGAAFTACADPHAITANEGQRTRRIRAVDAAGNADPTPASHSWTIDRTGPVITIAGPTDGSTVGPFVVFTFSANEGTITCRFDNAAFAPCSGSVSRSLAEGAHSFTIRAVDALSNATQTTLAFTVDCIAQTGGSGGRALFHFEELIGQTLANSLDAGSSAVRGDGPALEPADPQFTSAGRFGRALDFDASDRDTVTWRQGTVSSNRHSIEAWVLPRRANVGDGDSTIFISQDGRVRLWYAEVSSTQLEIRYSLRSTTLQSMTIQRTASFGVFHHIVAYFNFPTMQLWVDGVPVQASFPSTGDFDLGEALISDPSDPVDGIIDEVFVGTGTLSEQQILSRYCPL